MRTTSSLLFALADAWCRFCFAWVLSKYGACPITALSTARKSKRPRLLQASLSSMFASNAKYAFGDVGVFGDIGGTEKPYAIAIFCQGWRTSKK